MNVSSKPHSSINLTEKLETNQSSKSVNRIDPELKQKIDKAVKMWEEKRSESQSTKKKETMVSFILYWSN